jgi:AcrR family transcriptional regulator
MDPVAGTVHETHETRERLLEAAEVLFAERGFEAASVREITAEAGCNVAAVNYHFGSKEKLYLETFRRLLGELRDRRIERLLSDMAAAGEGATLEDFLESMARAFLEPLIAPRRGNLLTSFMMREMIGGHLPREVFVGEFIHPVLEVALDQLRAVGPPLDPVAARLCLMSLVGQLLHAFKAREMFAASDAVTIVPADLERHIAHIVRFSAAGIRGCADRPDAESTSHAGGSGEDVA